MLTPFIQSTFTLEALETILTLESKGPSPAATVHMASMINATVGVGTATQGKNTANAHKESCHRGQQMLAL